MEKIKKVKDILISQRFKILFVFFFILAFVTRGYQIGKNPIGMHVDEAGMAYDAFCLATNCTDRFLNHFPVYLINFGGGQSALYAYLCAIFIKIFGISLVTIRMPIYILSILCIVAIYFMTKNEKGENSAILFMGLTVITPWNIMLSRLGLDCNLLAPMLMISLWLLIRAKSYKGYVLAGISFGLTLYTYALSYIIIPVLLFFTLIYMLWTKRINFKQIIVLGIPIFILACPLMLMILINNDIIPEIKGFISINRLQEYRGSEISLDLVKRNLNFYKIIFTHDNLEYNVTFRYGTFYAFSIPLILLGLGIEINNFFKNIYKRKFDIGTVFLFQFVIVFILMHLIWDPNINRANAIFIPMIYFMVPAIRLIYKNYKILFGIIIALFIVFFIRFEKYYFNEYMEEYKYLKYFESDYIDALYYVNSNPKLKDKNVHVISGGAEPYIYTLVESEISPQEFNDSLHLDSFADDKFSYGKYYFENRDIDEDAVYILKFEDAFAEYLNTLGFEQDEGFEYKTFRVIYKK